jgi:hypothetical protein
MQVSAAVLQSRRLFDLLVSQLQSRVSDYERTARRTAAVPSTGNESI